VPRDLVYVESLDTGKCHITGPAYKRLHFIEGGTVQMILYMLPAASTDVVSELLVGGTYASEASL
jgi:hypothetical protein